MELFNEPTLSVIKNNQRYEYYRMLSSQEIPYYVPKERKDHSDLYVYDPIFLPINKEAMNRDRTYYHYGFLMLFICGNQQTLSIGRPDSKIGNMNFEVESSVARFRYYMERANEIIIDKQFEPLYPIQFIDTSLSKSNNNVDEIFNNIITSRIDLYTNWYSSHKI